MPLVSTKTFTAQNTWSDPMQLQGDDPYMGQRRATFIIIGGSTVTVQVKVGANWRTLVTITAPSELLQLSTTEDYRYGVATGDHVESTVVEVLQ